MELKVDEVSPSSNRLVELVDDSLVGKQAVQFVSNVHWGSFGPKPVTSYAVPLKRKIDRCIGGSHEPKSNRNFMCVCTPRRLSATGIDHRLAIHVFKLSRRASI